MLEILVVEDNITNIKILTEMLKEIGGQLLVAKDGAKAIKIAEKRLPKLILLDINIPEQNGFEVCQHLKSKPETKSIPIIFVSALNGKADMDQAYEVGGSDYVTKPFTKNQLMTAIQRQLDKLKEGAE